MKTIVKSTLAVALISMIANSAYYLATAEMNHLAITRPVPLLGLMLANHLIYALLMSTIYVRFRRSGNLQEGAIFGLLMGALMFIPSALVVRSAWEVPLGISFICNTLFALASSAVMGLVVARIQRK